jgi:hypothetical protein
MSILLEDQSLSDASKQIANQFGAQKIHGRGRNFREQNGPFSERVEGLEIVGHRLVLSVFLLGLDAM